jgi:glyoxylase-like metal-dependent hydrolase (beta-lactamase superfamily II)
LKGTPSVQCFFHNDTNTCAYLVWCRESKKAALIDSCADYNPFTGQISFQNADTIVSAVKKLNLQVELICETHVHADHLTGLIVFSWISVLLVSEFSTSP